MPGIWRGGRKLVDEDVPLSSGKCERKPERLVLLPAGMNRASYVRAIGKVPDAETRRKLEELLQNGDFTGVQELLRMSLKQN
jgi:hypothetical protein